MFWAAPTSTASIKGVVPTNAARGSTVPGKRVRPKNPRPVTPIIYSGTEEGWNG